jgi:hypothetical protein
MFLTDGRLGTLKERFVSGRKAEFNRESSGLKASIGITIQRVVELG